MSDQTSTPPNVSAERAPRAPKAKTAVSPASWDTIPGAVVKKVKLWANQAKISHPKNKNSMRMVAELFPGRCHPLEDGKSCRCPATENLHWVSAASRHLSTVMAIKAAICGGARSICFQYGSEREVNIVTNLNAFLRQHFTTPGDIPFFRAEYQGKWVNVSDLGKRPKQNSVRGLDASIFVDIYVVGDGESTPQAFYNVAKGNCDRGIYMVSSIFPGPGGVTYEGAWYRDPEGLIVYTGDMYQADHARHDPCDWRQECGTEGRLSWNVTWRQMLPEPGARDDRLYESHRVHQLIHGFPGLVPERANADLAQYVKMDCSLPVNDDFVDAVGKHFDSIVYDLFRNERTIVYRKWHMMKLMELFPSVGSSAYSHNSVVQAARTVYKSDAAHQRLAAMPGSPVNSATYADDLAAAFWCVRIENMLRTSRLQAGLGSTASQAKLNQEASGGPKGVLSSWMRTVLKWIAKVARLMMQLPSYPALRDKIGSLWVSLCGFASTISTATIDKIADFMDFVRGMLTIAFEWLADKWNSKFGKRKPAAQPEPQKPMWESWDGSEDDDSDDSDSDDEGDGEAVSCTARDFLPRDSPCEQDKEPECSASKSADMPPEMRNRQREAESAPKKPETPSVRSVSLDIPAPPPVDEDSNDFVFAEPRKLSFFPKNTPTPTVPSVLIQPCEVGIPTTEDQKDLEDSISNDSGVTVASSFSPDVSGSFDDLVFKDSADDAEVFTKFCRRPQRESKIEVLDVTDDRVNQTGTGEIDTRAGTFGKLRCITSVERRSNPAVDPSFLNNWVPNNSLKVSVIRGSTKTGLSRQNVVEEYQKLPPNLRPGTVYLLIDLGVFYWVPFCNRGNPRALLETVLFKECVQPPYSLNVQNEGIGNAPEVLAAMKDLFGPKITGSLEDYLVDFLAQLGGHAKRRIYLDELCKHGMRICGLEDELKWTTKSHAKANEVLQKHVLIGDLTGEDFQREMDMLIGDLPEAYWREDRKNQTSIIREALIQPQRNAVARQVNATGDVLKTVASLIGIIYSYSKFCDWSTRNSVFTMHGRTWYIVAIKGINADLLADVVTKFLQAPKPSTLVLLSGDDSYYLSSIEGHDNHYQVLCSDISKCDKSTRTPMLDVRDELFAHLGVPDVTVRLLKKENRAPQVFVDRQSEITFRVSCASGYAMHRTGSASTTFTNTLSGFYVAMSLALSGEAVVAENLDNHYARYGFSSKTQCYNFVNGSSFIPGDFLKGYWFQGPGNGKYVWTFLPSRWMKLFKQAVNPSCMYPDSKQPVRLCLSAIRAMLENYPMDWFSHSIVKALPKHFGGLGDAVRVYLQESMQYSMAIEHGSRPAGILQTSGEFFKWAAQRYCTGKYSELFPSDQHGTQFEIDARQFLTYLRWLTDVSSDDKPGTWEIRTGIIWERMHAVDYA